MHNQRVVVVLPTTLLKSISLPQAIQPTEPDQRCRCPTVSMETLMRELLKFKPHVLSKSSLERWRVTKTGSERE